MINIENIEELPSERLLELSALELRKNCILRTNSALKCRGCTFHDGTECRLWDMPSEWQLRKEGERPGQ